MTQRILVAVLALALGAAAGADVTMKATATGEGLGMSGTTSNVTYIKGLKMRSEATSSRTSAVTIFDVDAQKMYLLNPKKMEAEVWDMAAFTEEVSKSVAAGNVRASLTPNGQTKTLQGHVAEGYNVDIAVPVTLGGPGGMPITFLLTGVSWIAKGAPGAQDYAAFYKGASEKGWIFSDPRQAKGAPGQAKAMAQMYAEFAKVGGIPLETQMDIKGAGEGPVAAMMSRLGKVSMTTTIDSVEAGPIDDALFQVPADYKIKQR